MRPLTPRFVPWAALAALRPAGSDPPEAFPGLWCSGTLDGLGAPCVAIVGTRAASQSGRALARRLGTDLAEAGVTVVSGLALGIDAAAHEGALEAGGPSIGILGGGHECFFPPRNRDLAERLIAEGGAVCSPFEPGEPALPHKFLQRNGAVAALSDAVVVVEAPARSGALNTAGWAAGRIPVFVIPGDVDRRSMAGCLALLRDGATLVRGAADILADLGIDAQIRKHARVEAAAAAGPLHAALLEALDREPATADALARSCASDLPPLLVALTELELEGAVEKREGGVFVRAEG